MDFSRNPWLDLSFLIILVLVQHSLGNKQLTKEAVFIQFSYIQAH